MNLDPDEWVGPLLTIGMIAVLIAFIGAAGAGVYGLWVWVL